MIAKLLGWIERHRSLITILTAFLFVWQLVHLYWLTFDIVAFHIFGGSFFELSNLPKLLIIFVDYIEIPALISASLLYISHLYAGFHWKSVWFLFFLNTQWLHMFWITDEFIINQFISHEAIILPIWLAWIAILIDYLELPVILDTLKDSFKIILNKLRSL